MLEYILLVLLIINIVLTILFFIKNKKDKDKETNDNNNLEANITERLGRFEVNINKEVNDFRNAFVKDMDKDFDKLNKDIEERLLLINEKVNNRLDQNFEKTNKTFTNILERLAKIDEAQKKIDSLSNDIVSLQGILTDKKSRGIYGEVNLKQILSSVFGDNNEKIYRLQYTLPNGTIADSILFAPEPLGTIAIDSKFPLDNYRLMIDKKAGLVERQNAEKQFKADVKKHIDAIADKYIIKGVTSDQAIMFLPAEAIFAELNAYHSDIIEYAYKKRVWLTSPTTLMSTLTTIELIIKNIEKDKYTSIIHEELNKLSIDFERYKDRWNKLSKSIDTVSTEVKDIHTTTDKISKRFEAINNVDVAKLDKK